MRICICGGGSLGHVCAGVLSAVEGVVLNVLSGQPDRWSDSIMVTDSGGKRFVGHLNKVSEKPEEVVKNQDMILLCVPGFLIEKRLEDIKPYVGGAMVGSVVSSTGFFFFAHRILGIDKKLFGFERAPFISRVEEYGKSANLLGYKKSLRIAIENIEDRMCFQSFMEKCFFAPVTLLENYLEVSLTNSNPILHTGRLYSMFYGREKELFPRKILFYKEWTDDASEILIRMDEEFFQLLDVLGLTKQQRLLDYYESIDAPSLTKKIRSIPAFQSIEAPMCFVGGGWKADFRSRYFTEDFPYGLRWIKELADKYQVKAPMIDKVYFWGLNHIKSFSGHETAE